MLAKLIQSGGLNAITRRLGAAPAATLSAGRALIPGLLEGLRKFPGGMSALLELFAESGGVSLAEAIMGPDPVDTAPGEAIIARIGGIALGGEAEDDETSQLRLQVAPLLVMLVVGYLSARAKAGGLDNEALAALLVEDDSDRGRPDAEAV